MNKRIFFSFTACMLLVCGQGFSTLNAKKISAKTAALTKGPFKPSNISLNGAEELPAQEYLSSFVYPFSEEEGKQEIKLYFKDTALSELNQFMSQAYDVSFIPDDAIMPEQLQPGQQKPLPLSAIKLSFYTHKPLTKKEAWDLYTSFLDMAGLTLIPGPTDRIYRITNSTSAKGALPTYIGVDPETLPDNDMKIRYLFFAENGSIDTINMVANTIKSASAGQPQPFPDLGAILITDKSTNIKAMMRIIKEIDRATLPEAMSIIKLNKADAQTVAAMFTQLIGDPNAQQGFGAVRPRKASTKSYFPSNMRIIAEPRTNTLILLGTHDALQKVEDFIRKEIDKSIELPYSPLHIYKLKYAYAPTIEKILREVTNFNPSSEAAKYGGVRDGDKYFKSMTFVAEPTNNTIVISADYEDYLKVFDLLKKLDVEQPQVAIQILILDIDLSSTKSLGGQLRNKYNKLGGSSTRDLLGFDTNFQTSGLNGSGIITNPPTGTTTTGTTTPPGSQRLLGNLINLVVGNQPGSTLVTLGEDMFGVWGILKILQAETDVTVVSNPYLLVTHKTSALISAGETRRVSSATVVGTSTVPSNQDLTAATSVQVLPLISQDGLTSLSVTVTVSNFTDPNNQSSGNRTAKTITTQALLRSGKNDYDVLALGGLNRTNVVESFTKVPILGDIPVLGWLFKNKTQIEQESSLVILISAQQIDPHHNKHINQITDYKVRGAKDLICSMGIPSDRRDPVQRWFFQDTNCPAIGMIEEFENTSYADQTFDHSNEEPSIDVRRSFVKPRSKRPLKNYLQGAPAA